jgi:hypothetical protein
MPAPLSRFGVEPGSEQDESKLYEEGVSCQP